MSLIKQPWTPLQVQRLRQWQRRGDVHPFTCGNDLCRRKHPSNVLVATTSGWHCFHCNYAQDWAHDFMVEEERG